MSRTVNTLFLNTQTRDTCRVRAQKALQLFLRIVGAEGSDQPFTTTIMKAPLFLSSCALGLSTCWCERVEVSWALLVRIDTDFESSLARLLLTGRPCRHRKLQGDSLRPLPRDCPSALDLRPHGLAANCRW